ncbi:Protein GLUTAMINE DUMPER like [Quillaja saponaria]|uniref:Protein GLUTAMINE DUMPER like n=1 Tax=Quillaja saponaria TaxID=32244 RepID=A0AAD7LIF2_QUISA|nr:Protein GLUTAMINE DUMPER like [Quillaja saponaria]
MRTIPPTFNTPTTTSSLAPINSLYTTSTATSTQTQRSPWHSPVPYLFGGLAAMLGLIAFALLILACSYWKLSGQLENREGGERDLENGNNEKEGDSANKGSVKVYEEKFLVIMAGDEKPTFLATPVTAKAFYLGEGIENDENKEVDKNENGEKSQATVISQERN